MKRCARRAVIGAAALVAALLSVLVVTHWGTVRDHVEAWHFQLTRETKTMEPRPEGMPVRGPSFWWATKRGMGGPAYSEEDVLQFAADRLRCPMILDQREVLDALASISSDISIREELAARGWRVLEQRFPRRAYVLIRAADRPLESSPLMWDGVDLPVPTE